MASSSPMDHQKPNPPDPLHPLKCPRCDSSNTKFCYYNNYSLSQPRHFCKACKRYWTRGGTLRNVPVGGGCRKNKRSKRPSVDPSTTQRHPPDLPTSSAPSLATNRIHNPLFYNNNPIELNFPFSSFRVSSDSSGFDLRSQMNGFSSTGLVEPDHHHHAGDFKIGFKPYQDVPGHHNSLLFGSSTTTSTMASLLASSTHKFDAMKGLLTPYEDPGLKSQGGEHNRSVWNPNPNPIHDQINSSDPSSSSSSLLWNNANLGAWFDPGGIGEFMSAAGSVDQPAECFRGRRLSNSAPRGTSDPSIPHCSNVVVSIHR